MLQKCWQVKIQFCQNSSSTGQKHVKLIHIRTRFYFSFLLIKQSNSQMADCYTRVRSLLIREKINFLNIYPACIVYELIPFLALLWGQKIIWTFSNLGCLLSRKVWWAVRIGSFRPKLRYFINLNRRKGRPHENEFWLVSIQKLMLQTVKAEKVDERDGVICLASMFLTWVMVLKLSFLQFCADLSKKPKPVKAICMYWSDSSHYTLSENDIVYRVRLQTLISPKQ